MLDELMPDPEITQEQILEHLLTPDDIQLKTDLRDPLTVTRMQTHTMMSMDKGFTRCADLTATIVDNYMLNMVSYKRQSRGEVVTVLSEKLRQAAERTLDKAVGSNER